MAIMIYCASFVMLIFVFTLEAMDNSNACSKERTPRPATDAETFLNSPKNKQREYLMFVTKTKKVCYKDKELSFADFMADIKASNGEEYYKLGDVKAEFDYSEEFTASQFAATDQIKNINLGYIVDATKNLENVEAFLDRPGEYGDDTNLGAEYEKTVELIKEKKELFRNYKNIHKLSLTDEQKRHLNSRDENGLSVLHHAVINGDIEIAAEVLRVAHNPNEDVDINFTNAGKSALWYAVQHQKPEMVTLLLKAGASVISYARDTSGKKMSRKMTLLQLAVNHGDKDIIRKLFIMGDIQINQINPLTDELIPLTDDNADGTIAAVEYSTVEPQPKNKDSTMCKAWEKKTAMFEKPTFLEKNLGKKGIIEKTTIEEKTKVNPFMRDTAGAFLIDHIINRNEHKSFWFLLPQAYDNKPEYFSEKLEHIGVKCKECKVALAIWIIGNPDRRERAKAEYKLTTEVFSVYNSEKNNSSFKKKCKNNTITKYSEIYGEYKFEEPSKDELEGLASRFL